MTTKQCNTCNQIKTLEEFGVNAKNKNNFKASEIPKYKGSCKTCLAKKAKEYRDKNPNLWKKYRDKNASKNNFFTHEEAYLVSAIRTRIQAAKQNSKRNPEREFNITDQYMYELWKSQNGKCKLSGRSLEIARKVPNSLSIDKIDPSKGYVEGNVQWVTIQVNRAKSDLAAEDLLLLCKDILETCRDYPERE